MAEAWGTIWDDETRQANAPSEKEQELIREAHERFKRCETYESIFRSRFDYDYKFANGDSHNNYQWDADIIGKRKDKPCLTINKTQQHCLQVINDAKQNKPGVRIRPVGEDASFDGAQLYQEIVYHIEYLSNAENVYDYATSFQVQGGMGYWRVDVKFMHEKTFDQEIYINRVKDPKSVFLDNDINETDGSDARFGFIFDDMPKELFKAEYKKFAYLAGMSTLGSSSVGWITQNHVRVAEYFKKSNDIDTLVAFTDPESGKQIIKLLSELTDSQKLTYKDIKSREKNLDDDLKTHKERPVVRENIEWFKIAGNRIVDKKPWLGKYIPIVRLPGTETIIDGEYDCKGLTRSLINAQQMYNYNTSANVEYGALQTKSPWLASIEAIEGFENYYKTANIENHSYLPYNGLDEDGNTIPAPTRPQAPQASPAYVEQLKIAQNEMMMASGQYQSQMGENENAKSGVAINARQRQGDRATYHFIDAQAMAIRFTGKIIIDLIPKIYDTDRIIDIEAKDGSIMNIKIDPNAEKGVQKVDEMKYDETRAQQIRTFILNPKIGIYDLQADTGPSFATRRLEAFNALTQIAAQNKEFMGIAGDILWRVADFPEAQVLAQRWRKVIPPNITGDAPDPATEQALHAAADKIEQQLLIIAKQSKDLADRDKELTIRAQELDLKLKVATAEQHRLDYEAETKRLVALGNSGEAISPETVAPIVNQLLDGMKQAGEFEAPVKDEIDSLANVPGSRQAPDGHHYTPDPNRPGKFLKVEMGDAGEPPTPEATVPQPEAIPAPTNA